MTMQTTITEIPMSAAAYAMEARRCAVDTECAARPPAPIGLHGDRWRPLFRVDWIDFDNGLVASDLVCEDCANSIEDGELIRFLGGYRWTADL